LIALSLKIARQCSSPVSISYPKQGMKTGVSFYCEYTGNGMYPKNVVSEKPFLAEMVEIY